MADHQLIVLYDGEDKDRDAEIVEASGGAQPYVKFNPPPRASTGSDNFPNGVREILFEYETKELATDARQRIRQLTFVQHAEVVPLEEDE